MSLCCNSFCRTNVSVECKGCLEGEFESLVVWWELGVQPLLLYRLVQTLSQCWAVAVSRRALRRLLIFHVLNNWLLQWKKPAKGDNLHSVWTNIYEGRSSTLSGSFVIAGHQPTSVMHVCSAEQNNLRSTSPLLTRPYKVQIFHWIAAAYYCTAVKKQYKITHFKLFIARFLLQLSFCKQKIN